MDLKTMIPALDFCINHNIDVAFISSLQETGLIEIVMLEEREYIPISQLPNLEKFVRFRYELDINLEGIETITHLLNRLNKQQNEITMLKNKLRLYETDDLE